MSKTQGYHRLRIVTEIKLLIKHCYSLTEKLPKSELFGLTSQIRRSSTSILLNIVEGDRRRSNKEYYRFLNVAEASLAELEVSLELTEYLGFVNTSDYKPIEKQRQAVAFMLSSLMKKVKETIN